MPNNSYKILYILNENEVDEKSLAYAITYAKKMKANLHFLRVLSSLQPMGTFFHIQSSDLKKTLLDNLESSIEKFAPSMEGLQYSCHIRDGIWFIEALQEAQRVKADITIISEPIAQQPTFASNAMHLIRKSSTPIWVMRHQQQAGIKKILVPVDIDLNDKSIKNVNEKCMTLAAQIAQLSKTPCELIALHCWSLPNEMYLREVASKISSSQIDEINNRQRTYHEEWFNAFCKHHENKNLGRAYFLKGEPEEEIPNFLREEHVDLLIMGTVNNIATAGLYISSRAETILNASTSCSVVTVKPDGFISPVQ